MKPWEHPDAADQIPNPEGDDGRDAAESVYNKGVRKALEAVIIACDSGASVSQIREASQTMIDRLEDSNE